jgi:hypothetical protein
MTSLDRSASNGFRAAHQPARTQQHARQRLRLPNGIEVDLEGFVYVATRR